MGSIISKEPEIYELYFFQFPNKKKVHGTAIRVNGVIIMEGVDGRLYAGSPHANEDLSRKVSYEPNKWPWLDSAMKALVRLKIVSKEAADRHIAACEARHSRMNAQYALRSLPSECARAGIELTEEQIMKLREAAGIDSDEHQEVSQ